MKSKKIGLRIFLFVVIISGIIGVFMYKFSLKSDKNDLINISSLSEEFMDNYFEEVSNLKEEEKENILIVTSKEELENLYGATNVIEAPNNQYILQFDTKESKDKAYNQLSNDGNIDVSENIVYEISEDTVITSDYNSWGVEAMGIDGLIDKLNSNSLEDVIVAIVDTGLNVELFNQNYPGRLAGYYNILDSDAEMNDTPGHGTHIAGTIAESTPCNVKIFSVKITDKMSMFLSDIISGINYVTYDRKADIMNMSFGGYSYSKSEYLAVEAAKDQNIINVAAAGNDNTSSPHYPSAFDNTISVSALDIDKNKADFSNYNDSVMFAAPGVNILSINGTMSGTSMATPHIVGAIAILKSMNIDLTQEEVVTILRRYSDDLGNIGWDEQFGYGFVNFDSAQICEGVNCDEFNVFKKSSRDNLEEIVDSYRISPVVRSYNYGSVNNILDTKVVINYTNGKSVNYTLYDFPDLQIEGYKPNLYGNDSQVVNISFTTPLGEKIIDSFEVKQLYEKDSVWGYNKVSDDEIELTSFNDTGFTGNTLYLPSEIDGFKVVATGDVENSIFENAPASFSKVSNLYLPSSIVKIGENSFYYADFSHGAGNNIRYVESAADVLEVMDRAFAYSKGLEAFDANIIYVGNYSFIGAEDLMEVNLDNLTYIGESAFESALRNISVIVSEEVETIGDRAFYESGIKKITFLNDFEEISDYMFYGSYNLEEVNLPKNLKRIGNYSFSECKRINALELPESLLTIGEGAFYNALEYIKLVIPKNVVTIGEKAFMNNWSGLGLKEIIFTSNLKKIPDYMLFNNEALEEVILPDSIEEIGVHAFSASENLKRVYIGRNVNSIDSTAFSMISSDSVFYVYNNTLPEDFSKANNFNYKQIDPDVINVRNLKFQYEAFETIDLTDISLELTYSEKSMRTEVVSENIIVEYPESRNELRIGDTSIKLLTENELGYKIEKTVQVEVVKATPKYVVPDNLRAEIGQELKNIQLPDNFEWVSENVVFEESGNHKFIAKYVPEDMVNYKTVDNIEISIYVASKMYVVTFNANDGTANSVTQEIEDSISTALTKNSFVRDGYTFVEWNTKADGTGTRYTNGQSVTINDNLVLFAIWSEGPGFKINKYSVDDTNKYIDLIDINTSVDEFKKNIELKSEYTVEVDYKIVNNIKLLHTGGKTKIYRGDELIVQYTNIVRGDVNGNASVDIIDYIRIMKHIMKEIVLKDDVFKAADVNQNNDIDIIDYIRIMKKIMEEN